MMGVSSNGIGCASNVLDYLSAIFRCCSNDRCCSSSRYNIDIRGFRFHHSRCYACVVIDGGEVDGDHEIDGITLTDYLNEYRKQQGFSLDVCDTDLLKTLSGDILFCPYCYRPFDRKQTMDMQAKSGGVLETPFRAMVDILSIYLSYLLLFPLVAVYGLAAIFEKMIEYLKQGGVAD